MEDLLEYEGLVYGIINKYSGYFDREDLYQVGMMGLVQAYKNFDEGFKTKFSSYAYYYIIGEVTKFVRENRSIKLSKDIIKLNGSIEKCRDLMLQRLGREPTDTEIALFMEIDEEKICDVRESVQAVKSLDYAYEEDVSLYNSVAIFDNGMRDDVLDLKDALDRLSDEERCLLESRYYCDMTQSETSKKLGMSQVQVSRKEVKILEKLKQAL